ncbi:lysine-rich arabinogalactan protein 19-like [Coffea eugenioides]|uniref:lysine-rich arabinogalactan protein 19-like n=1 Tax=Coffea eugenioides TaxID=49369 RepID=UPI000F60FEB5|nr:lysine-rich arabinogalactan protein 19-like [Coffea eugenioides]
MTYEELTVRFVRKGSYLLDVPTSSNLESSRFRAFMTCPRHVRGKAPSPAIHLPPSVNHTPKARPLAPPLSLHARRTTSQQAAVDLPNCVPPAKPPPLPAISPSPGARLQCITPKQRGAAVPHSQATASRAPPPLSLLATQSRTTPAPASPYARAPPGSLSPRTSTSDDQSNTGLFSCSPPFRTCLLHCNSSHTTSPATYVYHSAAVAPCRFHYPLPPTTPLGSGQVDTLDAGVKNIDANVANIAQKLAAFMQHVVFPPPFRPH